MSADIPASIQKRTDRNHLERITNLIKNNAALPEIIAGSGISTPHTKAVIAALVRTKVIAENRPDKAATEKQSGFAMLVRGNLVKQLQKIDQSTFTGKIDIQGRSQPATIYIHGGRIVNADHGDTKGEKALFRIFSERGGVCKIINASIEVEEVITDPLDSLFESASREIAWRKQMKMDFSKVMVTLNGNHELQNNSQVPEAGYQELLPILTAHENMQTIIDKSPFTDLKTATLLNELKKKVS